MESEIARVAKLAALEAKVTHLEAQLTSMDHKLDDLLALRNKGVGAFWLATILVGAIFTALIETVKGLFP